MSSSAPSPDHSMSRVGAFISAAVIGLVVILVAFAFIANPILGVLGTVAALFVLPRPIREIRMVLYFTSKEFLHPRAKLQAVVEEHNEVAEYAGEIRSQGLFDLGVSSTGAQSHLATFENTSQLNYRRDRNLANFQAPNVHNCSLQVVRNASADPIKYLMKYFGIKATEETLDRVEGLGESIASLEGAIENLHEREAEITRQINPPAFILKHYEEEFMKQVGVELSPITIPYPVYLFEYVSAGGNSSQRTTVTLNSETIDALMETLADKIRFKKSAAGQRALMTSKFRTFIKERDEYTCQTCAISIDAEPHLLLEVDHIKPVSLGGPSTPENLQTLCWRCNRTKSNKMPEVPATGGDL